MEIPIPFHRSNQVRDEEEAEDVEKVFVLLAKAYIFGEKFSDAKYKEMVLKTMFTTLTKCPRQPGPESVTIIYEGTTADSPLRRLIATDIAYTLVDNQTHETHLDFFDEYPREALVDALKATVRARLLPCSDLPTIESYVEDERPQDTSMQQPEC